MFNMLTEYEAKQMLFEVYSAGFEAGYSQEIDIVTAYNRYWAELLKLIKE